MDFFGKPRDNSSPDEEIARAVGNLQGQIGALYDLADMIDQDCGYSGEVSVSAFLRMDLLSFALHIAASDGVLDPIEVMAINGLLGSNLSYAECKDLIDSTELASKSFNQIPPSTFKLLSEAAGGHEIGARGFAQAMMTTYEEVGMIISMIDGDVDRQERKNLADYVGMLNDYANKL